MVLIQANIVFISWNGGKFKKIPAGRFISDHLFSLKNPCRSAGQFYAAGFSRSGYYREFAQLAVPPGEVQFKSAADRYP